MEMQPEERVREEEPGDMVREPRRNTPERGGSPRAFLESLEHYESVLHVSSTHESLAERGECRCGEALRESHCGREAYRRLQSGA